MPVITISRQYASGGSDVAGRLAGRLGWPLLDNQFVDRVAERLGTSPEDVERREERVPRLIERLARTLAVSSPEGLLVPEGAAAAGIGGEAEMVRVTEAVIAQAVRDEPNVILVGRGAQAQLAERDDTLHVFIVAPRAVRIAAAAQRFGMTDDEAAHAVDRADENRRRYVETYYDRTWGHPANYHLVINTGAFTYDDATELIVAAARLRGWG